MVTRSEALRLIAEAILRTLPPEERLALEDSPLVEALEHRFARASNEYLTLKIRTLGIASEVVGMEPRLFSCSCCEYLTLTRRGHYDICPVCFWEDDARNDVTRYSPPNHMTLEEGRRNFQILGACAPAHLRHVDPEGPQKYRRSGHDRN